jgi:carboxyl-terminal processing protease
MENEGMVLTDGVDQPTIENNTLELSKENFDELKWMNFARMKAELARQVWGSEFFYPVINDYLNTELREAINLWDEADKLALFVQSQAEARQN